jgi:hypothetical protein
VIWYVLAFLAGAIARGVVLTRRELLARRRRLRDRRDRRDYLIQIEGPWRKPRK